MRKISRNRQTGRYDHIKSGGESEAKRIEGEEGGKKIPALLRKNPWSFESFVLPARLDITYPA